MNDLDLGIAVDKMMEVDGAVRISEWAVLIPQVGIVVAGGEEIPPCTKCSDAENRPPTYTVKNYRKVCPFCENPL